jgi:hypothetical protein
MRLIEFDLRIKIKPSSKNNAQSTRRKTLSIKLRDPARISLIQINIELVD